MHALLIAVLAVIGGPAAFAHSMYQSSVILDFRGSHAELELQMPPSRLSAVFGQHLSPSTLTAQQSSLSLYILARVHAYSSDHRPFSVRFTAPLVYATVDGAPYLVAHLELTPPTGDNMGSFVLEEDVILDSLPTHVALVSIRSDWRTSTFANDPQLVGVLRRDDRSVVIDRVSGSWWKGFGSVFHLGVRHIAEGTDHLLFLLALLLPAPLLAAGGRWAGPSSIRQGLVRVLKIVTAFTLGHSITLALATFGFIHVPGRPIEVLIAVSILVSAIHAFRPIFPGREPYIAAGFGLIHGLAFASTLAELGLSRWERVASILSFNCGIEAMQLAVVVAILPSFLILSRSRFYRYFRIGGAAFAALAAVTWIVQRVFETANPVDAWISSLATHGVWFAVGILLLALVLSSSNPQSPLSDTQGEPR